MRSYGLIVAGSVLSMLLAGARANPVQYSGGDSIAQIRGAEDFNDSVLEAEGLVVVEVFTPDCGECRIIGSVLEDLQPGYRGRVQFYRLDADANRQLAQVLRISAYPTLMFFRDGELVDRVVGLPTYDEPAEVVQRKIKRLLQAS